MTKLIINKVIHSINIEHIPGTVPQVRRERKAVWTKHCAFTHRELYDTEIEIDSKDIHMRNLHKVYGNASCEYDGHQ